VGSQKFLANAVPPLWLRGAADPKKNLDGVSLNRKKKRAPFMSYHAEFVR